jgi:hypothetical protein
MRGDGELEACVRQRGRAGQRAATPGAGLPSPLRGGLPMCCVPNKGDLAGFQWRHFRRKVVQGSV